MDVTGVITIGLGVAMVSVGLAMFFSIFITERRDKPVEEERKRPTKRDPPPPIVGRWP